MIQKKTEHSAGGVVYKQERDQVLWLICKHSGYHEWALPKGCVEKGESLEETALREVEEETGIRAHIIQKIPVPETYTYLLHGTKIHKTVQYFLMEYVLGNVDDHDWEMEDVQWVEFQTAIEKLKFPGAKQVLKTAKELLNLHTHSFSAEPRSSK